MVGLKCLNQDIFGTSVRRLELQRARGPEVRKARSPDGQKSERPEDTEVQMEKSKCKGVQMVRSPKVQKSKDQKS